MIIVVAMFLIRLIRSRPMTDTHTHQYRLFENVTLSAQDFYQTINQAVQEKQYPNIKVLRVQYSEGTMMSGNREYLRIERFHSTFDICAAPFGKDYFISWWAGEIPNVGKKLLSSIPWVGLALASSIYGKGLYLLDAEVMFRDSINQIIEEAVAATTSGKGVRGIGLKETLTVPAKKEEPL